MRHLQHLAAAIRLNHARGMHTTDAAAIVTLGVALVGLLGVRQFAWALVPGAAIFWLVPAVLERVLGARGAWKYAPRHGQAARDRHDANRPSQMLVLQSVLVHAARALGIAWLIGRAMWVAGTAPVLAVLALTAAVYEVPKLLLPLVFGRRVEPGPLDHVLLQRSDVIGDLVMATPCIGWIKAALPGCRVSVLCRRSTGELLSGHPEIDDVITDPTATGHRQAEGWRPAAIGSLVANLRHHGIDAAVSLWDRPSSVYPLAALLAGIHVRAGNFAACGGWLLNRGVTRSEAGTRHEVEQNLLRVRALGLDAETGPRLSIALTDDNAERARVMLAKENVGEEEFLVALSPATSGTNRRLEADAYAQFVCRIRQSHGARTLLLGSAADRELTSRILAGAPCGTVDFAGQTSVGLLAAVIARCRVHVGGDSGPAHIAAALGVPGVVISPARSQKPLRWGPWMAPHRVVRKRPSCRLPCYPGACRDDACVRAIAVDDVVDAFNRVAAGDGMVEPLGGRRYWASLSLPVLVHAPDDDRRAEVMRAVALLRDAAFIEFVLMCRPGGGLDEQARAGGFETREADAATIFATIVEFGGGVVYDFAGSGARNVRVARWLAARMGSATSRVVASQIPSDPGTLTDALLAAIGSKA